MRAATLIALVLEISCGSRDNTLPPEAWGVSDYVTAGVPEPDHRWTNEEFLRGAQLLTEIGAEHPERLPRFAGARSARVFARLLEPAIEEPDATIAARFALHGDRYEAISVLKRQYLKAKLAAAPREWIELMGALLRETTAMEPLLEPFMASFGSDDPKGAVRRDALAQMRGGWGGMILGGLLIAGDARVPDADRLALVVAMTRALPVWFDKLGAEQRDAIRDVVVTLVGDLPAGPLRDAMRAIERLVAPGME